MRQDFEVLGFAAPLVVVRRKASTSSMKTLPVV